MDYELKAMMEKKIKAMGGGNYIGSKARTDENGEHLDIQFKKQDGTIETTTIDFPKPKDGKDGAKGEKGEKGDKGDPGGGSGTNIHNELEQLQGGKDGNYYHLSEPDYALIRKQARGLFSANRIVTPVEREGVANLVSVSSFDTLFGNREYGTTHFSNFRNGLKHIYNDGMVERVRIVGADTVIPKGEYTFTLNIPVRPDGLWIYWNITKIYIQLPEKKDRMQPANGRIEIKDHNGKVIWESCPNGQTSMFIDNTTGEVGGRLCFDIKDSIQVGPNEKLTVKFTVGDSETAIIGGEFEGKNLPFLELRIEELKTVEIADVKHIRDFVPSATSPESIFGFSDLIEVDGDKFYTIRGFDISMDTVSIFDTIVTPTKYKGVKVKGIEVRVQDVDETMTEFHSGVEYFEFNEPTDEAFFQDMPALKRIYIPNCTEILTDTFVRNCPELELIYAPSLTTFGGKLVENCSNVTIVTNSYDNEVTEYCVKNKVDYTVNEIPSLSNREIGDVLTILDNGQCDWQPPQGGRDEMAIHKYPDLTKDFCTFFEPYVSGVYRCFGMMENIPNGYFAGDNDFYAFVYAVSEKYKTVEILDIRSGRRFTKCMLAGRWGDWFEWGINQGGQVPELIWSNVFTAGEMVDYPLSDLGITENDVLWISCGERGIATKVGNLDYLQDFAASYFLDFANNKIKCWAQREGANPNAYIDIYKFVTTPVTPPRGGRPYLTLNNVIEDITNNTNKGDIFPVEIALRSEELHRNPFITLDFRLYSYTTPLIFDGRERWSFEFPFQPTGFNKGDQVKYTLSWRDQDGRTYEGFEEVIKDIIV